LAFFSWLVRGYYGLWVFPFLSLFLGAVTNALTVAFYPPTVALIGASGLVYVLFGLWFGTFLKYAGHLTLRGRLLRAAGFFVILLVPSTYRPETSYLAHGIGFTIGFLCAFFLKLPKKLTNSQSYGKTANVPN
jgi:rhomboid protease GluP